MSKGFRILAVMIGCLVVSLGARAAAPKYSFVELGYSFLDVDSPSFDSGSETFLTISYGFETFQVFAGYETSRADFNGVEGGLPWNEKREADNWFLGGGWHGLLGEPGDLVVNWGYNRARNLTEDRGDTNGSFPGYFGDVGIRWRIVKGFELGGFARYGDLDDLGDYRTIGVQALGYVGRLVVGVGYDATSFKDADDGEQSAASVFVRYNFGTN